MCILLMVSFFLFFLERMWQFQWHHQEPWEGDQFFGFWCDQLSWKNRAEDNKTQQVAATRPSFCSACAAAAVATAAATDAITVFASTMWVMQLLLLMLLFPLSMLLLLQLLLPLLLGNSTCFRRCFNAYSPASVLLVKILPFGVVPSSEDDCVLWER